MFFSKGVGTEEQTTATIESVQQAAAFADHNVQYQFRTENSGGQVSSINDLAHFEHTVLTTTVTQNPPCLDEQMTRRICRLCKLFCLYILFIVVSTISPCQIPGTCQMYLAKNQNKPYI